MGAQVALGQKARETKLYLSRYLSLEGTTLMHASEKVQSAGGASSSAAGTVA